MRIYLAGPEVFLPDRGAAVGAEKRAICAAHGLVGVLPVEEGAPTGPGAAVGAGDPMWFGLYRGNEALIRGCDALIANLTPFRGPSADPGTVFELGFMRGLGRPVLGYANTAARFGSRTLAAIGPAAAKRRPNGDWEDAEGMAVEDFGLHDNLMLEGAIRASGGLFAAGAVPTDRRWRDLSAFSRCVEAAAAVLRAGGGAGRGQPGSESSA